MANDVTHLKNVQLYANTGLFDFNSTRCHTLTCPTRLQHARRLANK